MGLEKAFGMLTKTSVKAPPNRLLQYSPGQLIIKEGDYGTSVYRITKGQVRVLKELQSGPTILTELGAGEIFGEMAFIDGGRSPRSTSVEAKTQLELEVWHPLSIMEEFLGASPVVRIFAAHLAKKLDRINSIYDRLYVEQKEKQEDDSPAPTQDLRKRWETLCKYRPLRGHTGRLLDGFVQEISLSDLRILIPEHILLQVDHTPGTRCEIFLNLPGEDPLMVYGEIARGARGDTPGYRAMRFEFIDLRQTEKQKIVAFIRG